MKKERKLDKNVKQDRDHTSKQLNPNNDKYWQSRGYEERPKDWKELIQKPK